MSYIGENGAGFVCAGRDGKIYIKVLGEDKKEIPLNLFKTYKFGEEYKISKVAYENGIESFKFGDETKNTLWLNQENIFIVDEEQVQNIYNKLNGLTINSFEGTVIIDPTIDMGDILIIDGKQIIYQGQMSLSGRFIADIKSKIAIKQRQETTVKKTSQKLINRRVQSRINEVEGKITQLVEENTENSKKLSEIEQTADNIKLEVDKKVDEEELGTKIEQNYEHVKIAWNQITEFIQLMIINKNASLAILDKNKNILMALDKTGQHFYDENDTPFGEIGVETKINEESKQSENYIAFTVESDYGSNILNGMAWGIKTKSDNKFFPIFYMKNFSMGPKNSDLGNGELVLASGDLVLEGIGAGIKSGGIKILGEPTGGGLYFLEEKTLRNFISINLKDYFDYDRITILDNIKFYKNQSGSNSFKIGNDSTQYCLMTDDGSMHAHDIYITSDGNLTNFGGNVNFSSIPTYQGDKLVYGQFGHRYLLSWTGSQLQFWIDSTNVGTLSDKRLKTEIKDIDEDFIKAIKEIEMKQFKVANRGGLISFGILAQDLIKIFEKYNKNPFDYEIVYETKYKEDDDTIYYGINYEQFLILKTKAQELEIKLLQEKDKQKDKIVQDLIKRVEALEGGAK